MSRWRTSNGVFVSIAFVVGACLSVYAVVAVRCCSHGTVASAVSVDPFVDRYLAALARRDSQ
jgi:hypothetical protein